MLRNNLLTLCLVTLIAACCVWASPAIGANAEDAYYPGSDADYQLGDATLVSESNESQVESAATPSYGCETCGVCSAECIKAARAKAAGAYKGVFYDNDFNYLCDPCYDECLLGDQLKRRRIGDHGILDIGGQLRLRYHHELGMDKGAPRFTNTTDDFLLERLRLFGDYKINDVYRFYAEGIFAESSFESRPPRGTDRNLGDILNLFFDVKLLDGLTFRIGRQELLYGAQRTVSPLDWSNTRRKFEGIKLIWKHGDWRVDAFWTAFVPIKPYLFDTADWHQRFYGLYSVYSGFDDATINLYYLGYDNLDSPFSLHTWGARVKGAVGNFLYEIEGAYQGGEAAGGGVRQDAGFATIGVGRKLDMKCDPTLWVYFDYASGDAPGGSFNGYNQLFPLGHKYLGFIDAVKRTNIESVNFLFTAKPSKKVNFLLWYYIFQSNQAGPVSSYGGTPPQGPNKDLGQELDLIVKYTISPRSNILFGYSHFWRGPKILTRHDADFFYTQWTQNF